MSKKQQMKLSIKSKKGEVRAQFAALCFKWSKKEKKTQVLLVSTRRTGRWVIPKGWPINGKTPGQSALREAYEEAGVKGTSFEQCVGHFAYHKRGNGKSMIPCIVAVYPVKVESLKKKFPELGEREMIWLSPSKAAKRVSDPALKPILRSFDPRKLSLNHT